MQRGKIVSKLSALALLACWSAPSAASDEAATGPQSTDVPAEAVESSAATAGNTEHGRPSPGCEDLNLAVRGADLGRAREIMLNFGADEGGRVRRLMWRSRPWIAQSRRYRELGGESPFADADSRMNWIDTCFSGRCDIATARDGYLVFGCRRHDCGAKGAFLLDRHGRLIATASASIAYDPPTAAARGPQGELFIFVENRRYSRDEIRRLLGAWYLLEREYALSGAPLPEAFSDILVERHRVSGTLIAFRECAAGAARTH